MTVSDRLSQWMLEQFERALPGSGSHLPCPLIVETVNPEFGDYQCNAAMPLAKARREAPRALAEAVVKSADRPAFLAQIEIAGPGFINLTLADSWIRERLQALADDADHPAPKPGTGRTVVMDYGSPNMTKPLHIGHLRSHNIGSAIDRIYRYLGYRVVADNHLGDWGTQFGITIMGYRHFGDAAAMREAPLEELERVYVKSYERGKADADWQAACRRELVKLQSGDAENLRLWEQFMRLSLAELDRLYARLGVHYDLVRGESFYRDRLAGTVAVLQERNLAVESEGALVVFLDAEKLPPCIVRKRDGGFNYATTDLATVSHRVDEFAPERIVYVTDERQQLHFRQVFAICRRLGFRVGLDHVWFGLMRLPEATFSTREGNVIKLEALLDEAERRAGELVRQSSPDLPREQQESIARAVGIGAVKYADLSQNPQSLVTFTWDKALSLDGNSGPYLQYAYARIRSVGAKYWERFPDVELEAFPVLVATPVERDLALRVLRFPDMVCRAAEAFKPNLVADYLFELAQAYSSYYQTVPFLKADAGVRESRVRLCGIVANVLRKGLGLLGLETPERI